MIQDYTANFSDLSNEKAMKLVDDYLAVEADRVKVKRAYVDEFVKALPGRKVTRFYQIENKMDAVIRDATMMGDYSVPATAASADTATVVLDGGTTPWLTTAADTIAAVLPNAHRRTLAGQQHNVEPDAIAPALADHFGR